MEKEEGAGGYGVFADCVAAAENGIVLPVNPIAKSEPSAAGPIWRRRKDSADMEFFATAKLLAENGTVLSSSDAVVRVTGVEPARRSTRT